MRLAPAARIAGCLCVIALMTGMPACSNAHDEQKNLVPSAASPIADVPIPAGFSMTEDSTRKEEKSGVRYVDHKYDGSDDVLPVVRFYRDQMPAKGWTFVDQNQLVHNEIRLHYTKTGEDCVVTVKAGTFDTHIRVQIDPAGQDAAK